MNKLILLVGLLTATMAFFNRGIDNTVSTETVEVVTKPTETSSLDLDSDGDGVSDMSDLDDDNDGILDTAEGLVCSGQLNRKLLIGYVKGVGALGLMINMLNNPANFSFTGTYNKIQGITFIEYANEGAVNEAQLLNDNIDVFYCGSNALDSQIAPNKLLPATNEIVKTWEANNPRKTIIVMQNNAVDYGYQLTDNNVNPNIPFGPQGNVVFTNGYWPVNTFNQSGSVQMTVASTTRTFETIMVDAAGKSTFIRDLARNMILFPDKTIFESNVANPDMTNITLKVAGDAWAYAFDAFLAQNCVSIDTDGDGIPNHLDTDSDNDGCPDAIEGSANIIQSQLTVDNRISGAVNTNGVPVAAGAGQGVGESDNAAIRSGCFCYKPPVTSGVGLPTKYGITALGRAGIDNGNWPLVRQGAWTVLESKEKGFVTNRVNTTADLNTIANPIQGMMVYDKQASCLKIYTVKEGSTVPGWYCFSTQACPD